jgi:hypothetical protein
MNMKGGSASAVQIKVRTKEYYNRLVDMGTVPARVAADRVQHCQLNHPENTAVDVRLKKTDLKLHSTGRIPNCGDLNAVAECRGGRWLD